jgi:hypothetical protein
MLDTAEAQLFSLVVRAAGHVEGGTGIPIPWEVGEMLG